MTLYVKLKCKTSNELDCTCSSDKSNLLINNAITILGKRTIHQSLVCDISRSVSLNELFIVRFEQDHKYKTNNYYMVLQNFDQYKSMVLNLELSTRVFHEIILEHSPQRFKIDVDFPDDILSTEISIVRDEIINKTKYICSNILSLQYDVPTNVCVCTSRGISTTNKIKTGYHITIGGILYAANVHVCREFNDMLISMLSANSAKYIDRGTSKSIQNWRLIHSCKLGQPQRVKHITTINSSDIDAVINKSGWSSSKLIVIPSLIRNIPTVLPQVKYIPKINLTDKQIDNLFVLMNKDEQESFIYDSTHDNIINFRRIKPSYCDICSRQHDNENSLYFIAVHNKFIKKCRRFHR